MNTIKFLLFFAGLYLIILDQWALGMICFAIGIGLRLVTGLLLFWMSLVAVVMLSGCGSFVKTENIYIDNSAVNNYVGNPCGFYLGDRCLVWKDGRMARNSDNPYKGNK
jgi:hypothetical protein